MSDTSPSPTAPSAAPTRRSYAGYLLGFAAVAGSGLWLGLDSTNAWSLLTFGAVFAALCLMVAVGPVARGARPRHAWAPVSLAGACFLTAMPAEVSGARVGPFGLYDLLYFTGYVLLIVWLVLLARHTANGTRRPAALLDTFAATIGTALVLWSVALGALAGGSQLPYALVWAVYPTVDVLLIALCLHHWVTLGRSVPALTILTCSLGVELVVATFNGLLHILWPDIGRVVPPGVHLLVFYGFAVAATHPSVVDLSHPSPHRRVRENTPRRFALVFITVVPAVCATAAPIHGAVDAVVRSVLVAALLTSLFVRLARTMAALSDAEAASRHRATHDHLTGLLNRATLIDALTDRMARNSAHGHRTAVLFIDCDDFKHVNDTWGHHAGDELLRVVARRLNDRLDSDTLLARHGGDEFVVAASVGDDADARTLADHVRAAFAEPVSILGDRQHTVTPSIGLAVVEPHTGYTADDALQMADFAMYEAKASGRGRYAVFDDAMRERGARRASVGDRLGQAIRDDAFSLYLQPIMGGPEHRRLVGWEALARWDDPQLGLVPPRVFIPLAVQLGYITDLGALLLRRACTEFARLQALHPGEDLRIAVNVAPQELQPGLADTVADAVRAARIRPESLWLEVTETMFVGDDPAVTAVLTDVSRTGVRVCIDDFGAGSASLTTLLRLPVDCVKIGGVFVDSLEHRRNSAAQLSALIDLLRSVGVHDVVVKNVATARQADALLELGCPMVQGRHFGEPRPAADLNPTGTPEH